MAGMPAWCRRSSSTLWMPAASSTIAGTVSSRPASSGSAEVLTTATGSVCSEGAGNAPRPKTSVTPSWRHSSVTWSAKACQRKAGSVIDELVAVEGRGGACVPARLQEAHGGLAGDPGVGPAGEVDHQERAFQLRPLALEFDEVPLRRHTRRVAACAAVRESDPSIDLPNSRTVGV